MKWAYTWKANEHAEVVRAKARLVARGYKQREGTVFFDTFLRRPRASCFRLLGAVACDLGLDLCRFDAEQVFVLSSLEEVVFMRIPQGCGEMSGMVVGLRREASVEIVPQPLDDPHEEFWIGAVPP